ncbi:MAG: hypothetical protein H3C59_14140 [Burkholderiaceae bacterium]|nr:hypothetical protein [Burkholderiaceae bacterium]
MHAQRSTPRRGPASGAHIGAWFDRNVFALARDMRVSYLPPLMVYVAAGISGLTAIVGTFFVKEYLGLSAEFLAALGFWAGLPWALKMPLGHLVDLIWRHKAALVWLGASLIAASLFVMIGLLADPQRMRAIMSAESWYVLAALLAPIGYVTQDVVADAMTVEAVPRFDERGEPLPEERVRAMHTTMQTLGRVAIIGGSVLVALANVFLLRDANLLPEAQKLDVYIRVYVYALVIPVVSVAGVLFASWLRRREGRRLRRQGVPKDEIHRRLDVQAERPPVNWWVLGGGLAFAVLSLGVGLGDVPAAEEIVFVVSMTIVVTLMVRLTRDLAPAARETLLGTALVIFVFRALPTPGAGQTWWMIDVLGFDQQFLSVLAVIGSVLTLAGLFIFRRFMAERSIYYIVAVLTIVATLLSLPIVGMFYGLHHWTAAHTGGVVDARFIVLVDTAVESPLGQIAMVPMLAWIANSAPAQLKATYFAVMASFTNLALSASQLFTQYLNDLFLVTREVRDPVSGAVKVPADYSQLGELMVVVVAIGFFVPMATIVLARIARLRSA